MRHPMIVTYATLVIGLVAAPPATAGAPDAARTQYAAPSASGVPLGEETPPQQQSQPSSGPVAVPIGEETPPAPVTPPEAGPQVAGEEGGKEGELPFTGYAVLTVLGLGLLTLVAGLVLRRTTGRRSGGASGPGEPSFSG